MILRINTSSKNSTWFPFMSLITILLHRFFKQLKNNIKLKMCENVMNNEKRYLKDLPQWFVNVCHQRNFLKRNFRYSEWVLILARVNVWDAISLELIKRMRINYHKSHFSYDFCANLVGSRANLRIAPLENTHIFSFFKRKWLSRTLGKLNMKRIIDYRYGTQVIYCYDFAGR